MIKFDERSKHKNGVRARLPRTKPYAYEANKL